MWSCEESHILISHEPLGLGSAHLCYCSLGTEVIGLLIRAALLRGGLDGLRDEWKVVSKGIRYFLCRPRLPSLHDSLLIRARVNERIQHETLAGGNTQHKVKGTVL